ncbi:MAG: sulfotransferase family 2 domain-containing protein [Pseudomonadota bacterium]
MSVGSDHGPLIVHLHVPKCAGSSINKVLRERFPQSHLLLTKEDAQRSVRKHIRTGAIHRLDTMFGHVEFGIHDPTGRNAVSFSAVRDPVSRWCSFFNYVHTTPSLAAHKAFKPVLPDLEAVDGMMLKRFRFMGAGWRNALCRVYLGKPVNALPWEDIWPTIEGRMDRGELVLGDIPTITTWLRQNDILTKDAELPRQNTSEHNVRGFDDFVVARPDALSVRTKKRIERWNSHDIRLLEELRARGLVSAPPRSIKKTIPAP